MIITIFCRLYYDNPSGKIILIENISFFTVFNLFVFKKIIPNKYILFFFRAILHRDSNPQIQYKSLFRPGCSWVPSRLRPDNAAIALHPPRAYPSFARDSLLTSAPLPSLSQYLHLSRYLHPSYKPQIVIQCSIFDILNFQATILYPNPSLAPPSLMKVSRPLIKPPPKTPTCKPPNFKTIKLNCSPPILSLFLFASPQKYRQNDYVVTLIRFYHNVAPLGLKADFACYCYHNFASNEAFFATC